MIVFAVSGLLNVFTLWAVNASYSKANQFAVDNVNRYVEITLNEQWQKENGIRWTIIAEQTMETRGTRENRRITTKIWYHIGISALQNGVIIAQYQPVVDNNKSSEGRIIIPSGGAHDQYTHM